MRAAPAGSNGAAVVPGWLCVTNARASSTGTGFPVARTSVPARVSSRTDPASAVANTARPAAAETIRSKTSGAAAAASVSRYSKVSGRWTVSKRRTSSSW